MFSLETKEIQIPLRQENLSICSRKSDFSGVETLSRLLLRGCVYNVGVLTQRGVVMLYLDGVIIHLCLLIVKLYLDDRLRL